MAERIVVLKDYGNDMCLIAVGDRDAWNPDAQVRLAKRVKLHSGTRYDPMSMDATPAYQSIHKALLGLGFNVVPH